MGNALSAAVPSLILPVEAYICDLPDCNFMQSLGSTRFMKVAKVLHNEGPAVLKVFIHHDPSFSLDPYKDQVIAVRDALKDASNCCPYQKIVMSEKSAILGRQYEKDTLYDRLSTRPFLADVEKRWIAYQLLKAMEQCHQRDVCHGDIKSQNVLVSSWGWVQLCDFASFKPSFLPYDNPSDFTFFFDTSRRRSCYVAPERFLSTSEVAQAGGAHVIALPEDYCSSSNRLTHAMDIFSLACVMIELFSDGQAPFTFSQLLAYRESKNPEEHLERCLALLPPGSSGLKDMVSSMLDRDPTKRPIASQLLKKYRGKVFPDIFDQFVFPYLEAFAKPPISAPDDRLNQFLTDEAKILKNLEGHSGRFCPSGVILVSVVTSLIRALRYSASKQNAIGLLHRIAGGCSDSVVADRIMPYLVHMLSDTYPRVRCAAIVAVTKLLTTMHDVPKDDSRVFIDYVFPRLAIVANDSSSLVRMALARHLGELAETALRFFNQAPAPLADDSQVVQGDKSSTETEQRMMRRELKALHEAVQEVVVNLLCDADNNVRRAVVAQDGLRKLCEFFGKQKASDVLLSHMITFLNDKVDWRLRATFFECCPVAAAYIGWQSTLILKPLLQQGLRDFEEFVVFRTLSCLANLCQQGLLHKHVIYELLPDAVPFLAHPNEWLCVATVSFLSALEKTLNVADMHCKVMPIVNPYLKQPLIKLDRKSILLRCVKEPLPRPVWDMVVRSPLMLDLLDFLSAKTMMRELGGGSQSLFATAAANPVQPESADLARLYSKLVNLGLSDEGEEKLLAFRDLLLKMRKLKASMSEDLPLTESTGPGVVNLSKASVMKKQADLTTRLRQQREKAKRMAQSGDADANMNQEWQTMFGGADTPQVIRTPRPTLEQAMSAGTAEEIAAHEAITNRENCGGANSPTLSDNSLTESISQSIATIDTTQAMDHQVRMSQCRTALTELVEWKREEWARVARFDDDKAVPTGHGGTAGGGQQIQQEVRLEGRLVAHLHEHRASVNRLAMHPDRKIFASCSSDGSVKLWNAKRIEGHGMANRSETTYSAIGDKVRAVHFLDQGERFAAAGDNCAVHIVDTKTGQTAQSFRTDPVNQGALLGICAWADGVRSTLLGVSHHGHILCYDTRCRSPMTLWSERVRSDRGLVTSFCVDPMKQYWMCVGTASGKLLTWDLRFQLEVNVCTHPANRKIMNVWANSTGADGHAATVWASADGNGELGLWDLETGARRQAIWPADNAPLSYPENQPSMKLVSNALTRCDRTSRLYIGDSTGAIRCWNPNDPKDCCYLSGPDEKAGVDGAVAPFRRASRFYKLLTVDGIPVLTESTVGGVGHGANRAPGMAAGTPLDVNVTSWHKDAISDLLSCHTGSQTFLVSASRDGVIKVWR
uniref:non-specific serine/threonine protein kinase n=1 Tax=Plectus sambesii TaxID=2011161 RepID=A0A914VQF4_9BILA